MTPLSDTETQVLREALDDEYRAWATYDQVIADFGPVQPFVNIRAAEARHIDALHELYRRYRLTIPDNPYPGKVARYPSLTAACEAGIEAEIVNGEMYTRLMATNPRLDILTVLRNLQAASQQRHLPAFQRCARRATDPTGCATGARQRRRGRAGQT
jgi:hypothetical protein